jgi:cysteine desulfurase
MPDRTFLDHNATTCPLPEVCEAMDRCWRDAYANPGSRHAEGRAARRALETARESIAAILGARPDEVIFTSGGTEAANLALLGLAEFVSTSEPMPPIFALTAGEHPATGETCRKLEQRGWRRHVLPVDTGGMLSTSDFGDVPWNQTRLVSVILAHNETGVIQDLAPLAARCAAGGIPLHVDAVQAVGKIAVDFHQSGATALSLGAHKFYGPRGIGALLLRKGVRLAPQLFGGHQEAERRPGTEPVALVVGMATALQLWNTHQSTRTEHVRTLRDRFESRLLLECAPAIVHGARSPRLPNTTNIAFPGVDGEAMLVALDLAGISCSLGSTCASGSAEPAPALLAMSVSRDVALSSVRFSLGFENTAEEIEEAASRIARVVGELRRLGCST